MKSLLAAAAALTCCSPSVAPIEPNGRLAVRFSTFRVNVPNTVHVCPAFVADQPNMTLGFWVDQVSPAPDATHCDSDGADNTSGIILERRYPATLAGVIDVPGEMLRPDLISVSGEKVQFQNFGPKTRSPSEEDYISPAEGYVTAYSPNDPLYKIFYKGRFTGVIYTCSTYPGIGRCGVAFAYKSAIAGYRWYPNAYQNHVAHDLPQILAMAVDLKNSLDEWSQ